MFEKPTVCCQNGSLNETALHTNPGALTGDTKHSHLNPGNNCLIENQCNDVNDYLCPWGYL